jgi:type III pantothenate kinase
MKPAVVVDVGNTRVKWGRCSVDSVAESVSLPADDPAAWQDQIDRWRLAGPLAWVVTGVHPQRRDRLAAWLRERGGAVHVLDSWQQLPLRIRVEHPEKAGIDRLLNAVAANHRRPPGVPAVVIDAGSAVTVDWLDETGSFGGGAIFPGLRLMARALHDYTALLPLIDVPAAAPPLPGLCTRGAMAAGVFWAAAGGIQALTRQLATRSPAAPVVFLTGGDAALLRPTLPDTVQVWPLMTLEGVRLTAEALP